MNEVAEMLKHRIVFGIDVRVEIASPSNETILEVENLTRWVLPQASDPRTTELIQEIEEEVTDE